MKYNGINGKIGKEGNDDDVKDEEIQTQGEGVHMAEGIWETRQT